MNRFDLCANSATLSQAQKDFANQALWAKIDQVGELYDSLGATGIIYLGGSLSLRQPALLVKPGHPLQLKSDIDLFYLLQALPPGAADKAFLTALAELPQDIEVSAHVLPAVDIDEPLYSTTFDDIAQSVGTPLREGFSFKAQPVDFQTKSVALHVARMVGATLAPHYVTTHEYANVPGDLIASDTATDIKVALLLLRFLCYETLGGDFHHRSLLRISQEGFFDGVCSREFVEELVRRREQVNPAAEPLDFSMLELFRAVMSRGLALPPGASTQEIYETMRTRYLCDGSYRDSMHALLLALSLWILEPTPGLLEWAGQEFAKEGYAKGRLAPDLSSELEDLLAQASPTRPAVVAVVTRLLNATMQSATDRIREQLAEACSRAASPLQA